MPVRLDDDTSQPEEGYRIDFSADPVTVSASGHAGWLYGLITLGQILRGARRHPLTYSFPASGEIVDAIAETGWTAPGNKSWQRFAGLAALMPNLYGYWADAETAI